MRIVRLIIALAAVFLAYGSKERTERAATGLTSFTKLSAEENENRLQDCGRLDWPVDVTAEPKWSPLANYPWILDSFQTDSELDTDAVVVISPRHVLADRHVIRRLNLETLFGQNTSSAASGVVIAPIHNSSLFLKGYYCIDSFNETCGYARFQTSPTKLLVDDILAPTVVLFEVADNIPIRPVCLPEKDLEKGETVFVQHRELTRDSLTPHNLSDMHRSGWVVHEPTSRKRSSSQILIKMEREKFVVAGNGNQYVTTNNTTYQLFWSTFASSEAICQWTGACPALPRVELARISKTENEDRLQKCGRLLNERDNLKWLTLNSSTPFSLPRHSPWIVEIERSDGHAHVGVIISQKHIIVDWYLLGFGALGTTIPTYEENSNRTITTKLPVMRNSTKLLDYVVKAFRCDGSECGLVKVDELHPTKISLVPKSYAILEMKEDMHTTPACLLGPTHPHFRGGVVRVSNNGSNLYEDGLFPLSERFEFYEAVLKVQDLVFSSLHSDYSTDKRSILFRPWDTEAENICGATGICPTRVLTPNRLAARQRLNVTDEDDRKRRRTCGKVSNVVSSSRKYVAAREDPWLVGARKSWNSTSIYSGVIISNHHALIAGDLLKNPEDIIKIFGELPGSQSQILNADLPSYKLPGIPDFELLIRVCDGIHCYSYTEVARKPTRLIFNTAHPSICIFEFADALQVVPLCMEDLEEVRKGDEIRVLQYSESPSTVLNVSQIGISAGNALRSLTDESEVLIRVDNNRCILSGVRSAGSSSSKTFNSIFSITPIVCQMTGVCPPLSVPVELDKLSVSQNNERLERCGRLPSHHRHSNSTDTLSVAHHAPWLVKVTGSFGQTHSGIVVSSRHVMIGARGIAEDVYYKDLAWLNSTLPLPLWKLDFRLILDVCQTEECDLIEQVVRIPKKITSLYSVSFVLEFEMDLNVTPVCLADSGLRSNTSVLIQNYLRPENLFDENIIINHDGSIGTHFNNNYVPTYSEALVYKNNGVFALVGMYLDCRNVFEDYHYFVEVYNLQKIICQNTGICSASREELLWPQEVIIH